MPKNFDYFGGTPKDTASAIAAFMQATGQTFAELGRAQRHWADAQRGTAGAALSSILAPLARDRETKERDRLTREQRQYEEGSERQKFERETAYDTLQEDRRRRETARIEELRGVGGLLETGVREQGLDARESAEMLQQLFRQPTGPPAAPGPPPGPGQGGGAIPPPGPMGFQIGQQEGYQGMQREGLNLAARAPQGLRGITRHPPQPSWEQQRFEIEQAQKAREQALVDQGVEMVTAWSFSPEAKTMYFPVEMTGLEALGLGGIVDPRQIDSALVSRFGHLAPQAAADGSGVDRSALDSYIKALSKKQLFDVPNQAAFRRGVNALTKKLGSSKAAIEAMKQLEPPSGALAGAAGPRMARDVVRQHVLRQLGGQKQAESIPSVQGGLRDVLGLLNERQTATDIGAPPQAMTLTPEWLARTGFAADQIPMELRVAMNYPMRVERGRFVLDTQDLGDPRGPIPPPTGAQAALDGLMARNPALRARALAMSGTPEQQRTPSEAREMGLRGRMAPQGPPAQQAPRYSPSEAFKDGPVRYSTGAQMTQPPQRNGVTTPGMNALDEYIKRVQSEMKKAAGGGR